MSVYFVTNIVHNAIKFIVLLHLFFIQRNVEKCVGKCGKGQGLRAAMYYEFQEFFVDGTIEHLHTGICFGFQVL